MKRTNEIYRLAEDHLTLGFTGRIYLGQHITFDQLSALDRLNNAAVAEYPIKIIVDNGSHTSETYLLEDNAQAISVIRKIVGAEYKEVDEYLKQEAPMKSFSILSHKGAFNFTMYISKSQRD